MRFLRYLKFRYLCFRATAAMNRLIRASGNHFMFYTNESDRQYWKGIMEVEQEEFDRTIATRNEYADLHGFKV